MTVKALIEQLQKQNPEAEVRIRITEPYDKEPATLTEDVSHVSRESVGVVVIS